MRQIRQLPILVSFGVWLPDLKVRLGVGEAKTLEALAQEVQSGASRLMLLVRIAGRVQG